MKLSKCSIFFIRKRCARAFPVMCEVLGTTITEDKLLPIFVRLCEDKVWGIRKTCAYVLPHMSLLVSMEARRKSLVPCVKKLLFDDSEWVIATVLKHLGQFLATFAQPQIFGLAYDYRLELSVTNAADERFRQLQVMPYGAEPNNAAILHNLEMYERDLESLLPGLTEAEVETIKSAENSMNIDEYLSGLTNGPEFDMRRASIGEHSDDTGISEDYRTSVDYKSSYRCKTPVPPYIERSKKPLSILNTTDEVLSRFVALCMPLINNFMDGPMFGYSPLKDCDDDTERGPHAVTFNTLRRRESSLQAWPPLPPHPPTYEPPPMDDTVNNNSNPNQGPTFADTVRDDFGADRNHNICEDRLPSPPPDAIIAPPESADELAEFNSHRYWYIPPPALDLPNSNVEDEEKERTSSCDSTVIVTSDLETLEICESDTETGKPKRDYISAELMAGESEWCLIEDFLHMIEIDGEMLYMTAYYFPAVLFTFGSRFWPLFQPYYIDLCCNFQQEVRRTMAASISQVAMIIGREYATKDLVAPYLDFFKDDEEIKMGVTKSISMFVKVSH